MGQKKKTGVSPKTIKWIWYAAFAPFALVALMLVLTVFGVFGRMPSFEELENPRSNLATEIYSEDGKVIGTFFVQNRSYVQYADLYPSDSTLHIRLAGHEVPPIVAALIATEDVRFHTHSGIDIPSLARVAVKTLLLQNTSQGGGSTITQQLIKNLTGDNDTSVKRKLREAMRALELEKNYEKDDILEMYLNTIYFGQNAYGVKQAAKTYFNKELSELTLAECAALAGTVKNPFGYDLKRFPEANAQRREVVLKRMVDCGNLSEEARQAALKEDVQAWRDTGEDTGDSSDDQYQSYFTDAVIRQVLADLQSELGYSKNMALQLLYSGGLFIVLLLLLTGVVVAMTKAFTRQNAMELGELTAAVEDLSKNGGAEALPPQCSEESQALYTRFRELIAHNDELLNRRRQMEIKHLEEQFNPHFVYNVMETVRYQISEDPETASEMLLSFASLMRYSVNYGHTKVLLETDVEYVNDYLLLQKARYNNCLLYDFDIPEELLECRVPKLLLQPVIENSIVHGYRAGRTLSIRVQAEHRDDTLRFIVTDDGAGIPAGRLAELRESFEHDLTNEYAAHVGLYNIQKVIRLTYGAPYGVQIESTEGQGTAVTLTIPYEVEENEGC